MRKGFAPLTGFTILELLVVVAIAALILSFIFVSIRESKARSRDARREEDIKQLQNALSLHSVNNQQYPACTLGVIGGTSDCLGAALIAEGTMSDVPRDPLGGTSGTCDSATSHVYCYESADGSTYTLHYHLETDTIHGKSSGWQTAGP